MINTEIKGDTLLFQWIDEIPCLKENRLWIRYSEDISETPRHVANFTFAMVMLDALLYSDVDIYFDELTEKEKSCIENHRYMAYASEGCCGKIHENKLRKDRQPMPVHALKVVEGDTPEDNDIVLVSNGFGKDALNALSLSKEMGFNTRSFTVGNHTSKEAWDERMDLSPKITEITGVENETVTTNFFKLKPYYHLGTPLRNVGFYPYFYGLPLAYAHGSRVILGATEIHNSKYHKKTFEPQCAPESIFSARYFTDATGVTLSSPTRAVTEYGSQKIFTERYPELKHLQRSCDKGVPYCNHCSKCSRTSMNLSAMGRSPRDVGLLQYEDAPLNLTFYHRHMGADRNVERKLKGEPYEEWVEGANKRVFRHTWMGDELKDIVSEHLPLYSKDPGLDEEGYLLAPSTWGGLLKNGLVHYMREKREAV